MGSVQVFPKRRPFTSFYSTDISLRKQKFSAKAAVLFFKMRFGLGLRNTDSLPSFKKMVTIYNLILGFITRKKTLISNSFSGIQRALKSHKDL